MRKVEGLQRDYLWVRKSLLSTGELIPEAVIVSKGKEFFESSPVGMTVGLKELQRKRVTFFNEKERKYINLSDFDQKRFETFLKENFPPQIRTAFSLAFLKYSCYVRGFENNVLFSFVSKYFDTEIQIPKIICNILNGGMHANNHLSFCEFMIIPKGETAQENIRIASETYLDLIEEVKEDLGEEHLYIGREGGVSPYLIDVEHALSVLQKSIEKRNYGKCSIAIDVAANTFARKKGRQFLYSVNDKDFSTKDFIEYYEYLLRIFPSIVYLEDPFHEEDGIGWKMCMDRFGKSRMIVADDLTVSSVEYLEKYQDWYNACILKINQAGGVGNLVDSYRFCLENGIVPIISQRSGETDSSILAHIAAGLGSKFMKAGAPGRERIIKYNELLRIECRHVFS